MKNNHYLIFSKTVISNKTKSKLSVYFKIVCLTKSLNKGTHKNLLVYLNNNFVLKKILSLNCNLL